MKRNKPDKMSDPLQNAILGSVASGDISSLKFAKLHSPKMKSVYWRYFGFPTNEHDRIITKQNVVCTICHKVLTNHGNTTNLRAHLQHRHKDVFNKICAENGIRIPPRKQQTNRSMNVIKREPRERKIKLEYQEAVEQDSATAEDGLNSEDHTMLYETMVPMTYDDDEVIDANHFTKVEIDASGIHEIKGTSISSNDAEVICGVDGKSGTTHYRMETIEEMDPFQLQETLVSMLVQDLRNVDTLYDAGMSHLIRQLSGNMMLPSENKIESIIQELHSDKLTTLGDQIKVHSQVKPYSLGFEIWSNVDQKHYLSIYYNCTTDPPEYALMNQLYCTLEYNKYTSIDAVFVEFNLQNCTAAIVSYDYDDYLKHFLEEKNIPYILSFDVTIDKCLRAAFSVGAVASVIEEARDVLLRYASEITSKDVEIPTVNDDFPWTVYEFLKFFSDSVAWPEDVEELANTAKKIIETIGPLCITMDTLRSEDTPHSSMISPIVSKIMRKNLAIRENDGEMVSAIKTAVITELEKYVIADDNLTISALLDPRFHRLTQVNNINSCIRILKEKSVKTNEQDNFTTTIVKPPNAIKQSGNSARKSNLEEFFEMHENSSTPVEHIESNLENDLKRYRQEVFVSLDESPFTWWNKMGHMYGSLRHFASLYQCVPCVVNMNYRKLTKQQIHEFQKRFMLTGGLVDALLFLHQNGQPTNKDV